MSGKINYKSPELFYFDAGQTEKAGQEEYLKIVHNYIGYYYQRAEIYKIWYRCLRIAKYLILAVIPVSQTIPEAAGWPWIAAGASSLCIFLESVSELFQMKDKWILYRKVGNDLMSEERQFLMKAGGYDGQGEKGLRIFALNVEKIIGREASEWSRTVQALKTENTAG